MDTFFNKKDEKSLALPVQVPEPMPNMIQEQMKKRNVSLGFVETFRTNNAIGRAVGQKQVEMTEVLLERQADELRHQMALDLDLQKKKTYSHYQASVSELNAHIVRASNDMELQLLTIVRDDIEKLCDFYHDWLDRIIRKGRTPDEMEEQKGRAQAWFEHSKGQIDGKISKLMSENTTALKQTLKLLNTNGGD